MSKTVKFEFECEYEYGSFFITRVQVEINPYQPAVLYDRPGKMICDEASAEIWDFQAFDESGVEVEFEDGNIPEALEDIVWDEYAKQNE